MIGRRVTPALNDVMLGMEKTGQWMADGTVNIAKACGFLVHELGNYVWDEKASERGEDKPVKKNDHGCDAHPLFLFHHCQETIRHAAQAACSEGESGMTQDLVSAYERGRGSGGQLPLKRPDFDLYLSERDLVPGASRFLLSGFAVVTRTWTRWTTFTVATSDSSSRNRQMS